MCSTTKCTFVTLPFFTVLLCLLMTYQVVAQSVLSTGDWYKIAVVKTGIYKLDYLFLTGIGLDLNQVNPNNIAIYGNANNGMLPQPNSTSRLEDLVENAIQVRGGGDKKFDLTDFVVFYGRGANHLSYDLSKENFQYEKNLYTDTAFYFLTIKKTIGRRLPTIATAIGVNHKKSYRQIVYHEVDKTSIVNSGRFWYGELFHSSVLTHAFVFPHQGLVSSTPIEVEVQVLSKALSPSSYDLTLNNVPLGTITMTPVVFGGVNSFTWEADLKTGTFQISTDDIDSSKELLLNLTYNSTKNTDNGYMDYAILTMEKRLDLQHGSLDWYPRNSEMSFEIQGATKNTQVWDVSLHKSPVLFSNTLEGNKIRFQSPSSTHQLLAFNEEQLLTPIFHKKITNQNLHGMTSHHGLIITHPSFESSAQRLSDFRVQNDGLILDVVTVDHIYNEFSSGAVDITALRDFVKYIYDKNPSEFRYVLLFGDCSFDYKGRSLIETNFVPIYQSRESLHQVRSYASDDFLGFMDDDEGYWDEVNDKEGDHLLDIGIGRIPIRSNVQGDAIVNKIIRYQTSPLGYTPWRNNILFVADDGDVNLHQSDAEKMASYTQQYRKEMIIDKLYIDAYQQENNKSVAASQALLGQIAYGQLIINYTGHGNVSRLAHEYLFTESMITTLSNSIKMPFFITATCDFGKYDTPNQITGGEQLFLLPYGGAIGLLTSTRKVFASSNFLLNSAFYKAVFKKNEKGYRRLGDIMMETKNNSLNGYNNRNYSLLGDPSMTLAFPNHQIRLTHINDKNIITNDTLKALGQFKLKGEIYETSQVLKDFNGTVSISLFDKPNQFSTLNDEKQGAGKYDIDQVLLFQGSASVTNGLFEIAGILPKNINYSFGKGKIKLYAVNNTSTIDAHGGNQITIGGSTANTDKDKIAPNISMFLNDTTITSIQTIGKKGKLMVKLQDNDGINLSSLGFANQLMMNIDGGEQIFVSKYYTASKDTYKEGWLTYPLINLSVGKHQIQLWVSDIFNNESSSTITFYVSSNLDFKLDQVYSYPNPATTNDDHIIIVFKHDRIGEDLLVKLDIINLQGRKIRRDQLRLNGVSSNELRLRWNLQDQNGNRVDNGMYFYKLNVSSRLDNSSNEVYNKIIILK